MAARAAPAPVWVLPWTPPSARYAIKPPRLMPTLAHLSDLHATPVRAVRPWTLLGKRGLGWISWKVKRARRHRPEVLERLLADLAEQDADHVAITGDLTNASMEEEFEGAARWLERIGTPERVSLVPGNHDAYVVVRPEHSWDHWSAYLASDERAGGPAPAHADYPTLRIRGPLALVGLCSALPVPWNEATGLLGATQLERLGPLLASLRERGLCRVVLVHHPPVDAGTERRRRLTDAAALRDVLRGEGAELVLHGHGHRTSFASVPGPEGAIPVVGVRSSSHAPLRESHRAQYHLYAIEEGGGGFRIRARVRGYDPVRRAFVDEGERALV